MSQTERNRIHSYLWMVNRWKRINDFFGGCNRIPITVILQVILFLLLHHASSGVLSHVAKIRFLQQNRSANSHTIGCKTNPACWGDVLSGCLFSHPPLRKKVTKFSRTDSSNKHQQIHPERQEVQIKKTTPVSATPPNAPKKQTSLVLA